MWGSNDQYESNFNLGGIGADTRAQDLSKAGVSTINIKILNATHNDFWYSEDKWKAEINGATDPTKKAQLLEAAETNQLTTKFLAQLTKAAGTTSGLDKFLDGLGISKDKDGNLTVDLKKLKFN